MKNQAKKRLDWIDQVKGLAILGIVLFHFFQNYPDRFSLVETLYRNGTRVGYAAVDIFFIIAGFNISYIFASLQTSGQLDYHKINWIAWLKKRLYRLYPTYWLAIILTLCLYQIFSQIELTSEIDFALVFSGFATYKQYKLINPGFWFFSVILQAFLLTPIIFYICQKKPINILIFGTILGIFTKIICLTVGTNSSLFWFLLQNNFLASYIFQFCLGIYWGFIYFERTKFRKIDIIVSSVIFGLGLYIYYMMEIINIDIIYMLGFDILFSPFFFFLCYWLFQYIIKSRDKIFGTGIFALLGIYSYQIYLIHQPLLFVSLKPLAGNIKLPSSLQLTLIIMIITLLLVLYVFAFIKLELYLRKIWDKLSHNIATPKSN